MDRKICLVKEGIYLAPGACRLTVQSQVEGCVLLVEVSETSSVGWIFGSDGTMRGIVAESHGGKPKQEPDL